MSYWLKKIATAKTVKVRIPQWVTLTIAAYDELLKSGMRKDYGDTISDADFLDDFWSQGDDDDIYTASPSLEKAFVQWVADHVEDFLSDCRYEYQSVERARRHIMDNVGARDRVQVCSLDDWYEEASDILNELCKQRQVTAKA